MKISANICGRLVEIGVIFLVIFAPIYYGSVTLGTTTVIEITILFMLLIWGFGMLLQGDLVFRRTRLDIIILIFCLYSIISTLFFSRYAYASYMGLALVLCASALYFIVVNHIRSREQVLRLFVIILMAGFIHAFTHLVQNATGLLRASTGVMFNVGNHFAGYMVVIIPLAVAMSFAVKDLGKRILLIFSGIIMAAAMAFSLIAGAMLAFLLSLILVALLYTRSESTRKQALILGGVVLFSLIIIFWFGYKPVLEELLTITNLKEGSPAGRLSLWKSSFAMFTDNPVTGTGLGTFDYVYPKYRLPDVIGRAVYAHSDWLQLLTESGIVGLIIFIAGSVIFFVSVIRRSHLKAELDSDQEWMRGIVIGGISSAGAGAFHAFVEFNLHIPAIAVLFTIIIALTMGVSLDIGHQVSSVKHQPSIVRICIPKPVRVGGFIGLILIAGVSAVLLLRPCIADAYYQSGTRLEDKLRWDEAAEKYKSATSCSSGNSDYFYALGNIYAKRARLIKNAEKDDKWHKLALDACNNAIWLCPAKGDYHLLLAGIYDISGDAENADAAYTRTVSLDPNNAFYHRLYGSFCLRQGDIQKAVLEFKKTFDIYPVYLYDVLQLFYVTSSMAPTQSLAKWSFLDISKELCLNDIQSHITLARFFESKGWYDAAFSEYQQSVSLDPGRIDLWERLSSLLVQQDRIDEAVTLWRQCLKANPQSARAYAQLAAIYIRQQRLDDAIQQYLAAARITPEESSYFISASDLYMRKGEADKALELLQAAIRQNPYEASAHFHLGRYYEDQGDWAVALSYFQKAIATDPKNVSYRLHLAQGYYKRELFYEAIQEWERSLKLQPENVAVHLQLARVYQHISRQDKAREHYSQVLKIQPDNEEARKALLNEENKA